MAVDIVTVFGGTGYLGRAIVRQLLETGRTVRIAARKPHAVAREDTRGRLESCRVDVRDDASVRKALQGAAAAVNAVGLYSEHGDQRFQAIHVDGARRIAQSAAAADLAALVHVSGIGVTTRSESAYVRARAEGEQVVRAAYPAAAIVRPSVLFGPDDAFLGALTAITRLPIVPLFGTGATRLQPVHVEDIAVAVERVLTDRVNGVFELAGAQVYAYRDIVRAMLARTERRRFMLPVPFAVWRLLTTVLSVWPNPPLTRDQVVLMQHDNVVSGDAATFADLHIEPRGLDTVLPALKQGVKQAH